MDPLTDDVRDAIRARICTHPFEAAPGRFVRCQSRRIAACPSCAGLYRGDWERIARSGIYDADGNPVLGYRYFFITLSAPSFGKVHRVPKPWNNARRPCSCGATHLANEVELRGLPIHPDRYDYVGQVRWHGGLGRLWSSSAKAIRRLVTDAEYFAVREVQARMALHIHTVVRVPVWANTDATTLGQAARLATAAHPVTGEIMAWGQRGVQDREIRARVTEAADVSPDVSRAAARIVSYVGKALGYSLKDITPGTSAAGGHSSARIAFVLRLRETARLIVRCPECPDSGPRNCSRRAHDNLGFGGHVVTASRTTTNRKGWSLARLTRTRLREERRTWMKANSPAGEDGLSESQVRLAEWLAEQAAARARASWEARQRERAP